MYFDPGKGNWVLLDGALIERDALRVAEALAEYDPNLYVACNQQPDGPDDPPFIVFERCKDGHARPVLTAWVLDDRVVERVKAADEQRVSSLLTLEQMDANLKKERNYRYKQVREETRDRVEHILNIKSHYTILDEQTGELIHFYDDRPAQRTPRPTKRTNAK